MGVLLWACIVCTLAASRSNAPFFPSPLRLLTKASRLFTLSSSRFHKRSLTSPHDTTCTFLSRRDTQPTQRQQQSKNKKQRQQQQDDRGNKRPPSSANKRGPPGKDGEGSQERFGDSAKRARTSAETDGNSTSNTPASAAPRDVAGGRTREGVQQEESAIAVATGSGAGVEGLTVFVVNLPFTTRDVGLKDMFKDCGGARSNVALGVMNAGACLFVWLMPPHPQRAYTKEKPWCGLSKSGLEDIMFLETAVDRVSS